MIDKPKITMIPKYVYAFGGDKTEGRTDMRDLLGGKGANLAEMASLGIEVPPGFTITTEACINYFKNKKQNKFPAGLWDQVKANLSDLEDKQDKLFGDAANPLLVSVRSGARVSMPGMMDTVLNLGLNDKTVQGLGQRTGDERFALDCYRRFISMFGNVVLGIAGEKFEAILSKKKVSRKIEFDTELSVADLKSVIKQFHTLVRKSTNEEFPTDPLKQLRLAVEAVFNSWNIERARAYRRMNGIPHDWGTGVTIQAMVFGNMGES